MVVTTGVVGDGVISLHVTIVMMAPPSLLSLALLRSECSVSSVDRAACTQLPSLLYSAELELSVGTQAASGQSLSPVAAESAPAPAAEWPGS